jgi:LPS-assembly protein
MHKIHRHFKTKILCLVITGLIPLIGNTKITKDNPLKKSWVCSASKDGAWACYETGNQTAQLFSNSMTAGNEKDAILAKALGWIPTDNPNSITGGYYYRPGQYANSDTPTGKTSINFASVEARPQGTLMVSGNVEVSRGMQHLSASQATITADPDTKKVQTLDAEGNVNLSQPGQLIVSNRIQTNLSTDHSVLEDTYYLLKVNENLGQQGTNATNIDNFTGYARGHADTIIQEDQNHFTLKDATYTTGSPFDHDWSLSASELKFNKEAGWGQAYNAVIHVQTIPVFYWPYLAFPINDKRKSGFLYPTAGYNSNSGYYYSQPYYLNLAPNYDLTLTPTIYSSRGLMLGSTFRYLTEEHKGAIGIDYIPYDKQKEEGRASFGYQDAGQYTENLSSAINFNYVTDEDYYKDFDGNNIFSTNTTLLTQEGQLNYADQNWNVNGTVLNYQVLDNDLLLDNQPYSTLPQISANGNFPNTIRYLNYGLDNQFTYFHKGASGGVNQVDGQRLYVSPYIAAPLQRTWGHFTPKLTLTQTNYQLQNTGEVAAPTSGGFGQKAYPDSSINRTLPIFTIDTGLTFDRSFTLNKNKYTQIVEPRLFYNYIPYRDQSNIPLFDTSFTNFTYNSLFQANRFTGYDRINNANQLSYALQTEVNDEKTGQLLLSAGIGQMVYFTKQKVSLCRKNGCIDTENPSAKNQFSDTVAFLNYQFITDWYLQSGMSFDQNTGNVDNQSYAVQYMPDPDHIFNLSYQNIVHDYSLLTPSAIRGNNGAGSAPPQVSQVSTSAVWKLTEHWSTVGLWNYDFNSSRTINMYAGFQYNASSWAFRFLAQRYVSVDNTSGNNPSVITGPLTNAIVFQVQLKGLGGMGSGDLSSPLNLIPGYSPNTSNFN